VTVWDDVEEAKLNKEEVEELFEDQKLLKQASVVEKVSDKTKEKRRVFDPSASNNMTIILKRLPPINDLRNMLQNIIKMDNDILCKLLNAFPQQSDYEALI